MSNNGDVKPETPDPARARTQLTAGEMVAGAVAADKHEQEIGSFAARDEPAEYGYDYALADQRALATLQRVLAAEGASLDPAFQPGGSELRLEQPVVSGDASLAFEVPRESQQPADETAGSHSEQSGAIEKARDFLTNISDLLPEVLRGKPDRTDSDD
jgi:hypothetical protein